MNVLRKFKKLIFPPRCPFCGRIMPSNRSACDMCIKNIPKIPYFCGHLPYGQKCTAPFKYEGVYKKAVLMLKFKNRKNYAEPMSDFMLRSLDKSFGNVHFDYITCIPLSKSGFKRRGYNQSELLAKELSYKMNVNYIDVLEKVIDTPAQHSLSRKDRMKNVIGAYRIIDNDLIKGKNILLVDDIATTGFTLSECYRILIQSGVGSVYCCCFAKA